MLGLMNLYAGSVFAHDYWIDIEDFHPAAGETQMVSICGGHSFPGSGMALKDRVLHGMKAIKPDGVTVGVKTARDGGRRSGEFLFDCRGVYIFGFALKQPQMTEFMYWAKTIVVAGGSADNERLYCRGKGLEIVPGDKISALRKGHELELTVLYDGDRVGARLCILPEHGRSISLSTAWDRPAYLSVSEEGRYLVTAGYKGKSCSLTFAVHRERSDK